MHGESQRQSRRQSRRQSPGQVPDKVADLSRTQIIKFGNMICVADFHDLCPRQVHNFVAKSAKWNWAKGSRPGKEADFIPVLCPQFILSAAANEL